MATYILTSGDDTLTGTADADVFDGASNGGVAGGVTGGIDSLDGGSGDDIFFLDSGGFFTSQGTINGGDGTDTVSLNGDGDVLGTTVLSNVEVLDLTGNAVFASISQLSAFTSIINSTAPVTQFAIQIAGDGGTIDFSTLAGVNSISVSCNYSSSAVTITGTANNDKIEGSNFNDTVNGGAGDDEFRSFEADTLNGDEGDDRFIFGYLGDGVVDGGIGIDTVEGSKFAGTLTLSNVEVLEAVGGSIEATVAQINSFSSIVGTFSGSSRIRFDLAGGGSVDFSTKVTGNRSVNVSATSSAAYTITGSANSDILAGGQGNDTLNGGNGSDLFRNSGGTDTLNGDGGNDRFELYSAFSGTIDGGDGTDTIFVYEGNLSAFAFIDVETLEVVGSVIATSAELSSFAAIELSSSEVVKLIGNGGTIDFSSRVTGYNSINVQDFGVTSGYSVTATANDDSLSGSGFNDILKGGAGSDTLTGNGGGDLLDGGEGADTMLGGAGNDIYVVDNTGDIVDESASGSAGNDTVRSSISLSLTNAAMIKGSLENVLLLGSANINATGNGLNNLLTGNSGNNTLNGSTGTDVMRGMAGSDIYVVDNTGDIVDESVAGSAGNDTVRSAITFGLNNAATVKGSVENLLLLGSANIHASGNGLNNLLIGNSGNNVLNGSAGTDVMRGMAGSDTYVVDNTGDIVDESVAGSAGNDTVRSAITFGLNNAATVKGSVENLLLLGSANINASGNGLNNLLTGNSGNNVLNGSTGTDVMRGMAGSDIYVVDNAGDIVDESVAGSAGNDTVRSSISFSLASAATVKGSVENLLLLGSSNITATGNGLSNLLTGNSGNNLLNGASGNDILTGAGGNDVFFFNTALNAATNVDIITDFSVADDIITLENAIFTALAVGGLAASAFHIGAAAADAADRIIYNNATGALIYDLNGSAAGGATQFATLDPGLAITNADFVIV